MITSMHVYCTNDSKSAYMLKLVKGPGMDNNTAGKNFPIIEEENLIKQITCTKAFTVHSLY